MIKRVQSSRKALRSEKVVLGMKYTEGVQEGFVIYSGEICLFDSFRIL